MKILSSIKAKLRVLLKKDVIFPENKVLVDMFSSFKRGCVFGSAPSINQLDLRELDKDALVISMGNFHEHPDIKTINPQIHVFAASHPPITENVLRNWFVRTDKVLPVNTIVLVEAKDYKLAKSVFKSRKLYQYAYGGDFPIDFSKRVISPSTVAIIGIQLGYYIGLEELYLLGIDHDWQSKEGYGHFYDHNEPSLEYYLKEDGIIKEELAYTGRQPKERLYAYCKTYKQYESFKSKINNRNFEIYNADPNSGFDAFERKEINL